MSNQLRLTIIGLVGAVGGFGLQGCFAPQPTPECSVTNSAAGLGLGPYYAKLKKVDGTGSCGDLTHMNVGMQRFRKQANGGAFTLAIKTSPVTDPFIGKTFTADYELANNCVNEADCQGEEDPAASCVVNVDDGGVELFDSTPVTVADGGGTAEPTDGGDPFEVDLANECMSVVEAVNRRDATDPKGAKIVGLGQMPQFPNAAGVCAITAIEGGVQNFSEEVLDLTDGSGMQLTLPAITYKAEFTDFNVVNTAKVPGTAFTADFKYTEGTCVANYKAVGFWPEIHCDDVADGGGIDDDSVPAHKLVVSAACDPVADADAGRVSGSGISPDFKPLCDTTLGVCVPSVDVTAIK